MTGQNQPYHDRAVLGPFWGPKFTVLRPFLGRKIHAGLSSIILCMEKQEVWRSLAFLGAPSPGAPVKIEQLN